MRDRWLIVVAVASLCLNVALVGTYFLRRARHDRWHRLRGLTPEVSEKLRQQREAAVPEFAALAGQVQADDSLLWVEMAKDNPDSSRVDWLSAEVGKFHGRMRAMVFWQMHRELQLMPAAARTEYLDRMKSMRPGFGRPGMGRHMREGPPLEGEPPPGPHPESGY